MYNIKTMNHISPCGLQKLEARGCTVGENVSNPDGLILRSADLHDYAFEPSLIAIARSGAGTNNIPLEECCRRGIVVFNSPGRERRGGQGADPLLARALVSRCARQHRLGQGAQRPGQGHPRAR